MYVTCVTSEHCYARMAMGLKLRSMAQCLQQGVVLQGVKMIRFAKVFASKLDTIAAPKKKCSGNIYESIVLLMVFTVSATDYLHWSASAE